MGPVGFIGVAAHGEHGRDEFELYQDRGRADIPGMDDGIHAIEYPGDSPVERTVRVGDDPDERRRADPHQSPRAFRRAGTRLRDTGTCVPPESCRVRSSVPPYIGTTSRTEARLTR